MRLSSPSLDRYMSTGGKETSQQGNEILVNNIECHES